MRNKRFKNSNRGFTLIETMVVIVVIGIIAGIAIPAFAGYFQRQRLQSVRTELIADLAYTRSLAIARRTTFNVRFEANEYRIEDPGPPVAVLRTREYPAGVAVAATGHPNFYPWGLADAVDITVDAGPNQTVVNLLPNGSVQH